MQAVSLRKGDSVRHPERLEWGVGTVTRTEICTISGSRDLRVWVRFPNAGEKVLLASIARLEVLSEARGMEAIYARPTLTQVEGANADGWLAKIGERNATELMVGIAPEATDPFASGPVRLERTLKLYRYEGSGGSLIDWAVAQSGLSDPMTRFNRQELEQLHKRWLFNLDAHLAKLLQELRYTNGAVEQAARAASPAARKAIERARAVSR